MNRLLLALGGLMLSFCTLAQQEDPYEKRHSFAEAYFGTEINYMPYYQPGQFLNPQGEVTSFDRPSFIAPYIMIGATHFWGHADFYVSIATRNINLQPSPETVPNVYNQINAMTGMKIYPFALTNKTIRPYVGVKFAAATYRQSTGEQFDTKTTYVKPMVDIGISYARRNLYVYLGYTRLIDPYYQVPLSKTHFERVQIMPHFISFGINYKMETTKGAMHTRFNQRLNQILDTINQLGFFVGAGPSSAFPTSNSSYLTQHRPYLNQRAMPNVFPEFSVGYHFSKTDLNIALSYRFYTQNRSAFDVNQNIRRHSLVLESYKFLGDFHGFCPFIGGGVSYENIQFKEIEGNEVVAAFTTQQFTPVITFGWDIRPARKGDWWLLRTNLRYAPFLNIQHLGETISLQHVEFNFIQFVFYPQRLAQKGQLIANAAQS